MFTNVHTINLENYDGEPIVVSLRLSIGAQIKLKHKYNEPTTATLFGAMDDPERLVDVVDASLKFKGNENTVKSGEELIDLMAVNGMLGMAAKQRLISDIGVVSGLFSTKEKESIDARSDKMIDNILGEAEEKN